MKSNKLFLGVITVLVLLFVGSWYRSSWQPPRPKPMSYEERIAKEWEARITETPMIVGRFKYGDDVTPHEAVLWAVKLPFKRGDLDNGIYVWTEVVR